MLSFVLDMDSRWWSESRESMMVENICFYIGAMSLRGVEMPVSIMACYHDVSEVLCTSPDWRECVSILKTGGLRARLGEYETPISQGVSRAICAGSRKTDCAIIMFECGKSDFSAQNVTLSNCGWAAESVGIPIHLVTLGGVPSPSLLRLCFKTGGVHIPPAFTGTPGELMQALMFHLTSNARAELKVRPPPNQTHMGATCICHNKPLDRGYVCSICLAIYCAETAGTCTVCGSRIRREAKDEQAISTQTFSRLFNV